ncbi:MAG: dienelactone hydrolase family protein [Rhodospirillaceae bacterium]|jgi:carboxymethylenebutenolidase|nr:dienelactone hydrolase family protein [Rhodospirillaceae bacterium]
MPQTEMLTIGGSEMKVLVETPQGPGPHPAMIVVHHGPGLDDFTLDVLARLAGQGIVAVAPDFYHRCPPVETIKERVEMFHDDQIVEDIQAAKAMLAAREDVVSDRIGILGHCLGGRLAFLGAASIADMRVLAILYGGNIMVPWGKEAPAPIDLAGDINCPIIGFFGNEDTNPAPGDVDRIAEEFSTSGKIFTFHRYDDTGHAFQNFLNEDMYREASCNDAWAKLSEFLKSNL